VVHGKKFGQINVFDDYLPEDAAGKLSKIVFGIENLTKDSVDVNGSMPFITKIDKTSPGMVSLGTTIFNEQMDFSNKHFSTQIRKATHDLAKEYILSNPLLAGMQPFHGRMYLQLPMNIEHDHKEPHINLPGREHIVVLYYINDSDGTTAFYSNENQVYKEVEPKRNRLVIFDGSIRHSVGIPKHFPRAVLTYDVVPL